MGGETEPVKEETEEAGTISDLEQKIIRQVEYYFGNVNLCKDRFLRSQIKLDDGWIPLETLVKFNRLKSLSDDYKTICDALKKSPNELMEVNEDSTKVRRRVEKPVPEESVTQEAMEKRTLYVKGFKKTATLDELLDFFKEYKAEHIFMRRLKPKNKVFKGSCFVMFETNEDAEKFLELKGVKYEGTELLKETKKDYMARKDIFYENLRSEKEKKLLKKTADNASNSDKVPKLEVIPGCLLKVVGLAPNTIREDIKEPLEKYGTIVFVDHSKGKPEAVVRFDKGVAAEALEGATSEEDGVRKMEIKSAKVTVSLIEGEAEKEYWDNIAVSRANSKLRYAQIQKQNRGRFRKNWGKRRNRYDEDDDQQKSKKVKLDSNGEGQIEVKQESSENVKEKPEQMIEDKEKDKDQPKLKKVKLDSNGEGQIEVKQDSSKKEEPEKRIKDKEAC